MAVKEKAEKRRSVIVGLLQIKDKPQFKVFAGYALNFILGFAMTNSRVLSDLAPFGIGIIGRAGADWSGICCLIGACIGYIVFGGLDWGIRYVSTITLIFTVGFIFRDTKIIRKAWFMATVNGAKALGIFDSAGEISVGKCADLSLFSMKVLPLNFIRMKKVNATGGQTSLTSPKLREPERLRTPQFANSVYPGPKAAARWKRNRSGSP